MFGQLKMMREQLGIGGEGGGAPDGGGAAGGDPAAGGAPAGGSPSPQVSIPENWKDALPEEFRKEAMLEHVKDVPTLVKNYVNAQKMIGKDKVVIPDPKFATQDDYKAFYQKLGMPADIKDFKVELPKDSEFDQEFVGEFTKAAMENGILPGQANKLLSWYAAQEKQFAEKVQGEQMAKIQKDMADYKTKVGAAFPKKVLYANKALEKFGGPELMKAFGSNPALGADPRFIEMLANIGQQVFGEDVFQGEGGGGGGLTPAEARSKRNEIMGNQQHPYWNAAHPKHQEAVAEVNKLIQMENPGS